MATTVSAEPAVIAINLRNPTTAAFLAWLWPGAGHLYQGRTGKGILFMVCILGIFGHGLWMGEGRVVYAASWPWEPEPFRLPYVCQVGVGLPALPALLQGALARQGKAPLFGSKWYAPPSNDINSPDSADAIQKRLNRYFELGTVFTMIAGLLNILAIYDAWGGPVYIEPKPKKEEEPASEAAPDEVVAK